MFFNMAFGYKARSIVVALVATVLGGGLGVWIGMVVGAYAAMGYERGGLIGFLAGVSFSSLGLWIFSQRDL